jgi:hypothetical protein
MCVAANRQLGAYASGREQDDSSQLYLVCGVFSALAGLFKAGERGQVCELRGQTTY